MYYGIKSGENLARPLIIFNVIFIIREDIYFVNYLKSQYSQSLYLSHDQLTLNAHDIGHLPKYQV